MPRRQWQGAAVRSEGAAYSVSRRADGSCSIHLPFQQRLIEGHARQGPQAGQQRSRQRAIEHLHPEGEAHADDPCGEGTQKLYGEGKHSAVQAQDDGLGVAVLPSPIPGTAMIPPAIKAIINITEIKLYKQNKQG